MTNNDAIKKAVTIVLTKVSTVPVYPYTRPKTGPTEFIAINTLGLPTNVLQKGIVNVNIHVNDVDGVINSKKMYSIAALVREAFKAYEDALDTTYRIFFKEDFENTIQEESIHVLNIRYKVYIINNL